MEEIHNFVDLKTIHSDVNCWFIRTESGVLYNEYSNNQYISLGWNYLVKEKLQNSDKFEVDIRNVLEGDYREKKNQITKIINKCKNFALVMKPGDYIIFPNQGSTKYTIGILDKYFEGSKNDLLEMRGKLTDIESFSNIKNWSISEELSAIKDLQNSEADIIDSPFLKRWSFNKVAELSYTRIHPKLFISLRNPSSLTNLTENRDLLFSSIYPIFQMDNKLSLTFDVTSQERINAIDINRFTSTIVNLISNEIDGTDIEITQRSSVSSEGSIILDIINILPGSIEWFKITILFGIVSTVIMGGTYKVPGFEFSTPGLINIWKMLSAAIIENNKEKLDLEVKQYEFQLRKTEDQKRLISADVEKAIQLLNREGFSVEAQSMEAMLSSIGESSLSLEIDTEKLAKVIDLEKLRSKLKDDK